jgi:hypothetical protein
MGFALYGNSKKYWCVKDCCSCDCTSKDAQLLHFRVECLQAATSNILQGWFHMMNVEGRYDSFSNGDPQQDNVVPTDLIHAAALAECKK